MTPRMTTVLPVDMKNPLQRSVEDVLKRLSQTIGTSAHTVETNTTSPIDYSSVEARALAYIQLKKDQI